MKKRLGIKYPDLVFDKPKQQNQSAVVFSGKASFPDLVCGEIGVSDNEEAELQGITSDDDVQEVESNQRSQATPDGVRKSPRIVTPGLSQVPNSNLYYGCRDLNSAMASHSYELSWPPSSMNLTIEEAEKAVPPLLYNFLASLCGKSDIETPIDDAEFCKLPADSHSKLLSISQDIINLRSSGHSRTPKSVSLGMTMKHLTGSAHLVRLLNSLGHCSSYDSINRAETAIASDKITNPVKVPSGFVKKVLAVLVFDNIDFMEETLSGSGTTHQVNGIMYQRRIANPCAQPIPQTNPVSRRERSINPPTLVLDPFILGKRQGMPVTSTTGPETTNDKDPSLAEFKLLELNYLIAKKEMTTLLPSWTGYQRMFPNGQLLAKSSLHYLNVIEAPPNDMSTISYVLDISVQKADDLELDSIIVVFDQALYSKAQQIRWKNSTLQTRLVLRMGEFHTCMSFMGAIGKMFKLSGMEDILVEAGVVAEGSVSGVLSGHNYNRAIRAHKILYEALARLQLQCFLETLDELSTEAYHNVSESIQVSQMRDFHSLQMDEINKKYTDFVRDRSLQSPMFAFWSIYIDAIKTLLMFVRATRESNWNAHVALLRQMLPYFFSLDRQNYARLVQWCHTV